jgi:hypothetical protein
MKAGRLWDRGIVDLRRCCGLRWIATLTLTLTLGSLGWSHFRAARVSEQMTLAAQELLSSLSAEQRARTVFPVDSPRRVDWHFIPKPERKGLQLGEMSDDQRKAAHTLLRSVLSQLGYDKAASIMQLEALLRELESRRNGPIRDPLRYYFTVFGEPSADGRWGLSIEGHHLSLNFLVDKGQVVSSTPQVFAANPALVKSENQVGVALGTRVLKNEEVRAFELVNSLSAEQRAVAVTAAKARSEIRAAGEPQPPATEPEGIAWTRLSTDQQALLMKLIEEYMAAMPEEVAQERQHQIQAAGSDKIHFAWEGAMQPGVGHYYRIQGPTFLVEFVNTQPDSAGNPANHIHCIWRDMRGDFGLPIAAK